MRSRATPLQFRLPCADRANLLREACHLSSPPSDVALNHLQGILLISTGIARSNARSNCSIASLGILLSPHSSASSLRAWQASMLPSSEQPAYRPISRLKWAMGSQQFKHRTTRASPPARARSICLLPPSPVLIPLVGKEFTQSEPDG